MASSARLHARSLISLAAVLLAGIAIVWFRRPDQFTRPQLWAEDGIFFVQAFDQGWRSFTLELAGYFHLAPRLIAGFANLIDPLWVPHAFAGATLLFTLYVMARVMSPRCPLPLRPLCALALVLVPDANEVILNAVNIQWVFALGFVVLLISAEPAHNAQRVHDLLSATLFGLTGPFSIVMTPFFAARAILRRTKTSFALAAIVTTCAAVQAISIVRHPIAIPANPTFDPSAAIGYPGVRVLGGLLFGSWQTAALPPWSAAALTALTFALIAFLALRPADGRLNRIALALAFTAALASTLFRCWHSMPALIGLGNATRYVFPLQVLLLWLLFATARDRSRPLRIACVALALAMIAVNLPRLRQPPLPDKHWELYAEKLRRGEEVTIPINPEGWNFTFSARKPRAQPRQL